jgi:hypothetical protein
MDESRFSPLVAFDIRSGNTTAPLANFFHHRMRRRRASERRHVFGAAARPVDENTGLPRPQQGRGVLWERGLRYRDDSEPPEDLLALAGSLSAGQAGVGRGFQRQRDFEVGAECAGEFDRVEFRRIAVESDGTSRVVVRDRAEKVIRPNADGSGQRNLTRSPARAERFAWAPERRSKARRCNDRPVPPTIDGC